MPVWFKIECDACGREERIILDRTMDSVDALAVLKEKIEEGWLISGDRILCPSCLKSEKEDKGDLSKFIDLIVSELEKKEKRKEEIKKVIAGIFKDVTGLEPDEVLVFESPSEFSANARVNVAIPPEIRHKYNLPPIVVACLSVVHKNPEEREAFLKEPTEWEIVKEVKLTEDQLRKLEELGVKREIEDYEGKKVLMSRLVISLR